MAEQGNHGAEPEPDESSSDLRGASDWDVAIRYHELRRNLSLQDRLPELRGISALAILDRARAILGSVVHPRSPRSAPLPEVPPTAREPEVSLDESLESLAVLLEDPATAIDPDAIWMEFTEPRRHAVVLTVDTSLSMTGEKLALTAVALAVVLLEFPDDPVGIVAFENEARILKGPREKISLMELLERFLDVPAKGYTHLEDGLKSALSVLEETRISGLSRPPSTVLLSDGKYTAGKDPAYLAPRFPHLVVLKMGDERASLGLCQELAAKGSGAMVELPDLNTLPDVMYGVVKDLLRGSS